MDLLVVIGFPLVVFGLLAVASYLGAGESRPGFDHRELRDEGQRNTPYFRSE